MSDTRPQQIEQESRPPRLTAEVGPRWALGVKRMLDLGVTLAGLPVALPLAAGTAVAVRLSMGPGVLFTQERSGKGGKPFRVLKFRTMTNERDAGGRLLPDEQRLTRVGAFIRKTSLDELPQLFNVLRGEMSLVGPRPLPTRYAEQYTPEQAVRLRAAPGVTSLPAVSGRASLTWDQRMDLDRRYVEDWSLALDLKILGRTVFTVLGARNVNTPGYATSPKFGEDHSAVQRETAQNQTTEVGDEA